MPAGTNSARTPGEKREVKDTDAVMNHEDDANGCMSDDGDESHDSDTHDDADDMHVIAGAPHDRLFPLMHATLHHGGAGTTAAGLKFGLPTFVCPFFADQAQGAD